MEVLIQIVEKQWLGSFNQFQLLLMKDTLWNNTKQYVSMEAEVVQEVDQLQELKQPEMKDNRLLMILTQLGRTSVSPQIHKKLLAQLQNKNQQLQLKSNLLVLMCKLMISLKSKLKRKFTNIKNHQKASNTIEERIFITNTNLPIKAMLLSKALIAQTSAGRQTTANYKSTIKITAKNME